MSGLAGVILAAREADDELAAIVGAQARHVLPVANVPIVAHGVRALRDCGVEDVAVVVSGDTAGAVVEALAEHGHDVTLLEAPASAHLTEALGAARDHLDGRAACVLLGDSLVTEPLRPFADAFAGAGADALVLHRTSGGVSHLDRRQLLRLAEQPFVAPAERVLAGAYFVGAEAIARICRLDPADCATIADAMSALAAAGGRLETRPLVNAWQYSGTVDALLEANRMVLDGLAPDLTDVDLSSARVDGRAVIHPTAVLDRTTVRGPAVIGPGAVLVDAFVGPYTSIGEGVRLDGAEIEYSIVMRGASIRHPGKRLEGSLIGRNANVSRDFALPAALRLRVGTRAEVSLS